MLEDLHSRLAGVVIECLDYADFIHRYDGLDTLFYLDPPYWGCEDDYGKVMFARADFARLAEQLRRIKGGFPLSINDVPEIRELFSWAGIVEVQTIYTIANHSDQGAVRAELLIGNLANRLEIA